MSTPPTAELQQFTVEPVACWNEIGVYGAGNCPELRQFIHCRNCPVYSRASLQLLNRSLPEEYRREWAAHFAAEKSYREAGNTSAILFRIETEWLALPTPVFQEVAERRPLHSLPHRRQGIVLGMANVRGELLICVSLGHLLGLQPLRSPELLRANYHRLLVVNWEESRLVIAVDEVNGPHRFLPQELKSPPVTVVRSNPTYTRQILYWRQRAVGLLDPALLFAAMNRTLA